MCANRSKLDALAQALLERETLEHDEAYAAAGIEAPVGATTPPDVVAVGQSRMCPDGHP